MKLPVFALIVLTSSSLALAQESTQPYEPAVPPASIGVYGGGGYGGYGGGYYNGLGAGSTVAGSAETGMANVISAKGSYNLSTSAAAVNMTHAQSQEIQNHQQYENTYFEMRAENTAARNAEREPPPTPQQLARIAKETAPKPLSPNDINHVTGDLNWPGPLQMEMFASERQQLQALVGSQTQMGNLSYQDQMKARSIINNMDTKLKSQIRKMPPEDCVACKDFLKSLMFTTAKCHLS